MVASTTSNTIYLFHGARMLSQHPSMPLPLTHYKSPIMSDSRAPLTHHYGHSMFYERCEIFSIIFFRGE
eukprot:c51639_g1_i1 orf=160-366(+)